MSRIGSNPIPVPNNVTVTIDGNTVMAHGPLGDLQMDFRSEIKVTQEEGKLLVGRKRNDQDSRAFHGLTRSLIANMVIGVEKGWSKRLELVGVGYRANTTGDVLNLSVGYSHPVSIQAPAGVKFEVTENTKILVSGIDKALVGETSAKIRAVRKPEPYQGKGIRYAGEYVRRKAGKAGKAGAK